MLFTNNARERSMTPQRRHHAQQYLSGEGMRACLSRPSTPTATTTIPLQTPRAAVATTTTNTASTPVTSAAPPAVTSSPSSATGNTRKGGVVVNVKASAATAPAGADSSKVNASHTMTSHKVDNSSHVPPQTLTQGRRFCASPVRTSAVAYAPFATKGGEGGAHTDQAGTGGHSNTISGHVIMQTEPLFVAERTPSRNVVKAYEYEANGGDIAALDSTATTTFAQATPLRTRRHVSPAKTAHHTGLVFPVRDPNQPAVSARGGYRSKSATASITTTGTRQTTEETGGTDHQQQQQTTGNSSNEQEKKCNDDDGDAGKRLWHDGSLFPAASLHQQQSNNFNSQSSQSLERHPSTGGDSCCWVLPLPLA